ncbi:hypothetical protein [Parachlamydia acanthamoebae]|uniref:hypothetical protein n=1 Tax=Parachlamydia acanthamoebae TaxID=83552 RepID=UPI000751771A|nr:hypothetical protein [Parachlamydia acanthamoebae]
MGLTLLMRAGIEIAFLTSENSPIVEVRAKKLGIKHVFINCRSKKLVVEDLTNQLSLPLRKVAYMGDDVNDEAPMRLVRLETAHKNIYKSTKIHSNE